MEDQIQLVVHGEDGGYLLIESTSKKLHLPTSKLRDKEDFKAAALRCLKQVQANYSIQSIAMCFRNNCRRFVSKERSRVS